MTTRDVHERGADVASGRPANEDTCPECDGSLVTVSGETTCTECGLVVAEDRIDHGPEWRAFEAETRKRTGAPRTATRHDRGLSTLIGFDSGQSGRKRAQLSRLRTRNERAKYPSKAEQNLATAFGDIGRMISALELPQPIHERACELYREAQREALIQGRSIEAVVAGSVYAACRCGGATRTLAEVASVARCSQGKVELGYSILNRELGLATSITHPAEYIPQVASSIGAPDSVRRRAAELTEMAEEEGLTSGRNPRGVAAACLYLAGHENGQLYTQIELAELFDVTAVTLRGRFHELRELLR